MLKGTQINWPANISMKAIMKNLLDGILDLENEQNKILGKEENRRRERQNC